MAAGFVPADGELTALPRLPAKFMGMEYGPPEKE